MFAARTRSRVARLAFAAGLLLPAFAGSAAGESLGDLEVQMQELRDDLDASSTRIEQLRSREAELRDRIDQTEVQRERVVRRNAKLTKEVVARADELYRSGGSGLMEALFSSDDFAELTNRAEMLARVSAEDARVFVELARSKQELRLLTADLEARNDELDNTLAALRDENADLQSKLADVSADYERLKEQQRQQRLAQASTPTRPTASPVAYVTTSTAGKTCPVAGPVSFVDSWGAPRSGGRSHEGVDMMAAYGTPVVAIVSGSITYAGYGGSAGNWLILSGSDGNAYWYMHNQENLVSGGGVKAGQQIATVGDTGNAAGTPHLHFEYHPGGGGPVNPYPLVASIC